MAFPELIQRFFLAGRDPATVSAPGATPPASVGAPRDARGIIQPQQRGGGGNPFARAAGGSGRQFNAAFDPSRGGLLGLIGGLTGQPTQEQHILQQAGGARASAIQGIQQRIAQGMSPQKALADFVSSPEGQEAFISDPDLLDTAQEFLQTQAGPEPIVTRPGETLVSPTGDELFRNQPTEVQVFEQMSELAGLSDAEKQELARAQIEDANTGTSTQSERAVQRMLADGEISQDTANRLLAGALRVVRVLDRNGNTIGHRVVDITTGQTVEPAPDPTGEGPLPGQPNAAPGVTPPAAGVDDTADPATQRAQADAQVTLDNFDDPAEIVLGAGPVGALAEFGGGLLGNVFPEFSGEQATRARSQLRKIRTDAEVLRSGGRFLAAQEQKVDSLINTLGVSTNPIQAATMLIEWNDILDSRIAFNKRVIADPNSTNDARQAAEEDLRTALLAKKNVPPKANLESMVEKLRTGPSPVERGLEDLSDVRRRVEEEAGTAGEDGAQIPTEFSNVTEAERAFTEGFQSGSIPAGTYEVRINGVKHTLTVAP